MTAYCTTSDLIAFGVPSAQATQAACDLASRVVEAFCGTTFTGATVQTLDFWDVRQELLPLPVPFSSVTAVRINNNLIDPVGYNVDTNGQQLLLYIPGVQDVDGFPRAQTIMARQRGPFGQHVQVTGTFGYASVPTAVFEATRRLGSRYATTTVLDQLPPPGITGITGEGFSLRVDKSGDLGIYDTTGDVECDRMLAPYRSVFGMVG